MISCNIIMFAGHAGMGVSTLNYNVIAIIDIYKSIICL